jgi:hypothetical protein
MTDIVERLYQVREILEDREAEIARLRAALETIAHSTPQNLDAEMLRVIACRALEPKP